MSTYLGKFGDCNVPMDYTVPGLGSWVKKQRKNKNLSTSSQLQINKILNDANELSDQDYWAFSSKKIQIAGVCV